MSKAKARLQYSASGFPSCEPSSSQQLDIGKWLHARLTWQSYVQFNYRPVRYPRCWHLRDIDLRAEHVGFEG
jgi:hypothetical protein